VVSSPAVSPAVPRARRSLWILDPWRDLLLFVGTPLVILPAALLLQQSVASANIQYFVLAFGSLGHNLPGMLRAYGDRALFARFRTRFLLAPVLLLAACIAFSLHGSQGMVLIAYLWAIWHALMQVYGFCRIYDAKTQAVSPRAARWDLAMCLVWFCAAVLWSDTRLYFIQSMTIHVGIPVVPAAAIDALRQGSIAVLAAVTLVYVLQQWRQARAGAPPNPVKQLLIAVSIAFWWYANVGIADVLLGLVMFEVFHDVQYLTIVWLFNRRRVEADPGVGGFSRFVFRRSWGLLALYVALVFAYGGLLPLSQQVVTAEWQAQVAAAVVTASALLHFYFDGFIWKVRESSTRKGLGLDGAPSGGDRRARAHAAKWLWLAVPAAVLWVAGESPDSVAKARALAAAAPRSADAHLHLGQLLNEAGQHLDSLPALQAAQALVWSPETQRNLALAQLEAGRDALVAGDPAAATPLLRAAAAEVPDLLSSEHDRGFALWRARQPAAAIPHYLVALALQPGLWQGHGNIALAYRDVGNLERALHHARRAAEIAPHIARTREILAHVEELERAARGR